MVSVDWTGGVELPSSDGEMAVSEEVSGAPSAISQVETSLASAPMPKMCIRDRAKAVAEAARNSGVARN